MKSILPVLLLMTWTVNAAPSLPPVLDYYPECKTEPSETISQEVEFKTNQQDELANYRSHNKFAEALIALREQAAKQKAQAIIIDKIKTKFPPVSKTSVNTYVMVLNIEATLVNYCGDNTKLSGKRTTYNAEGNKVAANSLKINFKPIATAPEELYKAPPHYLISASSGVSGILPGQSPEQVRQQLGQPSSILQFEDKQIWGYGRQLWLTFDGDVQHISSTIPYLNMDGINWIELSAFYDTSDWHLEKDLQFGTSIDDLQRVLPGAFQKISEKLYRQTKNGVNLDLTYEYFSEQGRNKLLLTQFSIYEAAQADLQQPVVKTDLKTTVDLLQHFNLLKISGPVALSSLPELATMQVHQFNQTPDGRWLAVGPFIRLQVKDEKVSKLVIQASIFKTNLPESSVQYLIKSAGLPTTKSAFLAKYPETLDNGSSLELYEDNMTIVADYYAADDTDDAELESFRISLY